jgi:Pyruvate/2-oxoacid:ferredoxin oxidoreductase delta subunit
MALTDLPLRVILYEGAGAAPLEGDERRRTVQSLLDAGFGVTVARVGAERPVSPPDASPLLVLGRWEAGPPETAAETRIQWGSLEGAAPATQAESARASFSAPDSTGWKPWFPVIDYDRCTNCMQCLSFCLFGVYGVDVEKRIEVRNNDQCKTNCPACSRVCPEAAILFPKYKAGPINGDIVADSDLNREKMKIDISALLGGDVYSLLRTRSDRANSRFSKERDADKALAERQKCLTQLASLAADIPPEVLMSLPSPEEIAKKAAAAAALAASVTVTAPARAQN